MIEFFGGVVVKERISEAHLAADMIGSHIDDFPVINQDQWVTRAHNFSAVHSRYKLACIYWGTGDLMLRVYDKVAELKKHPHKQQPFADVWQVKHFDEQPVVRVEFQVRRPVLHQLKPEVNTLADLTNALGSLWHYLTCNWCKLSDGEVDRNHNQSRAKIHPWWERIQQADWSGDVLVKRDGNYPHKDLYKLRRLQAGVAMSIAAIENRQPDDIEGIIAFGQGYLEADIKALAKDHDDFEKRMKRKINQTKGPS